MNELVLVSTIPSHALLMNAKDKHKYKLKEEIIMQRIDKKCYQFIINNFVLIEVLCN